MAKTEEVNSTPIKLRWSQRHTQDSTTSFIEFELEGTEATKVLEQYKAMRNGIAKKPNDKEGEKT